MATIRLTNDIRRVIVKRLNEHAFDKREAALLAEEHALAAKVYDAIYPAKHQKTMTALPKGYLPTRNEVTIYVGGARIGLDLSEERVCGCNTERFAVAASDPLGKAALDFAKKKETLADERSAAGREARSVLNSVTSVGKLREVWPEIDAFVKDIGPESRPVTALAKPIAALNRSLGLPPGAKAA